MLLLTLVGRLGAALLLGAGALALLARRRAPLAPPRRFVAAAAAHSAAASCWSGQSCKRGVASPQFRRLPIGVLRRAAAAYVPDLISNRSLDPPMAFAPNLANPCWGGGSGSSHCLPAFLLLGVYQSGSHDLYARLAKHSRVVRHPATSPSFYGERHTWAEYMRALAPAAAAARRAPGALIGEASALTFHFVWVHQEQFNQPYVEAMGRYWRACNARAADEKRLKRTRRETRPHSHGP